MSIQLRYDDVPWPDFSATLKEHLLHPAKRLLITDFKLRDFRIAAQRNRAGNLQLDEDPKRNREVLFFFLREPDLVEQAVHQYLVISTDSDGADDLLRIAQRFRLDLRGKAMDTLFRVDPRYGIVVGSSLEPVNRFGVKERPCCFVTLVFSKNPAHPLVALEDYVDREDRGRFQQIFEKYNHQPPGKPPLMKRIFGSGTVTLSPTGWNYRILSELALILSTRYYLFPQRISLIFENVHDSELEACVLDRSRSVFQTSGTARFFSSTEELLQ